MHEVVSILNPGIGDPLQAFQQAVVLQGRGRLREAELLYEAVLKLDDRHLGAVYHLGLLRLQQAKYTEAMQLFRRAMKIDKNLADSQFNLANALTGLKHLEEAVQRYEKALALKPNFPEARNNLGFALQLLGRHEAASVQYEKALHFDRTMPKPTTISVMCCSFSRNLKQRLYSMKTHSKSCPTMPSSTIISATLSLRLGDIKRRSHITKKRSP